MAIELNVYHTIAVAVIILIVGEAIKKRVPILRKYCIPVPVVGGLLCTLVILFGHQTGAFDIKFDKGFNDFFMLLFYSGIGFTASWKLLKKGGPQVIMFLFISAIVVVLQNLLGVGLAKVMGINPLIGLATGSIPMTGGHGTSAAFAPILEAAGLADATTISLAAATFGLVAGSLIGGPTGRFLIEKYHLKSSDAAKVEVSLNDKELGHSQNGASERDLTVAAYQLLLAVSLGCLVSDLLAKTGLSFPASVGGMTAAAIIRNIADNTDRIKLRLPEVSIISNISLLIFLALSMMTLKLWQLADLAIPMIVLLLAQTVLMVLCAIFITFRLMGKTYDAAMITVGHCGFGLGAVPTAMANMQSIETKYGASPNAFFIVPLVGSLFINLINTFVITGFINFVK
ncbi:MAG: sodium/glutamate symporter [Clostridium sp.]